MSQKCILRVFFLAATMLAVCVASASAYETYSTNGSTGNCATCHGDFRSSPYNSLADSASWGDDLHDVHRNTLLSGDCNVCHVSSGRSPVFMDTSAGSNGFNISCNGCHGRPENNAGGQVVGAGLRQHHWNSGVTSCVNCHSDSNPTAFAAVGEDVLPPYYFTPDANHQNKPTDSCNPNGEENFAGTAIGLDNDGDGLYDLNDGDCQATTTAPDINLNPASLNFGLLVIGNSTLLDTQIENLGDADLTVSSIAMGAGTSAEFTFTEPGTPFTIPAGGSQTLSVTYQPINTGTDTGSLIINSNDSDEQSVSVSLSGSGEPEPTADINLNPAALSIGSILIGDSFPLDAVIQNLSTAALIVTDISPAAGTSSEFSFTSPATPFTIVGGGSQTVTVTYQPVDAGTDSGALVISSNDPDEPAVQLNMTGAGDDVPTPDIDISLKTVNFNNVNVGKTLTQTVTIQNLGTADLTINTINHCQGSNTEFSWLPGAPFTLQAKTSQILSISYAPVNSGIDAGCISVTSDDPDESTMEIGLEGTGLIHQPSILRFLPAILDATKKSNP